MRERRGEGETRRGEGANGSRGEPPFDVSKICAPRRLRTSASPRLPFAPSPLRPFAHSPLRVFASPRLRFTPPHNLLISEVVFGLMRIRNNWLGYLLAVVGIALVTVL